MKTLIVILIIASFLQTTILPIDLVLLIFICRAYIVNEKNNLYLAFAFGLLISHLNLTNLGFFSLIYLICLQITQMLSRLRLAGNPLLIVPTSLVLLFLSHFTNSVVNHAALEYFNIFLSSLLSIPILYLLRFWEERFVVRKEIRLKI